MQFLRAILTPLVAATLLAAAAPLVQAQNRGDDVLLEMQQAFRKGDRKKLEQLLPAARGHALEPWAAYWELKARLNDATYPEIQSFLQRYPGSYQQDRLRNDWLLLLGQRREWGLFADQHPSYRMGDDREVRCYALLIEHIKGATGPSVAESVRDKLVNGELDFAHVLYGLMYGVHLGVGGPKKDMAVLMTLNHNGQAISLSKKLADKGAVDGAGLAKVMKAEPREYTFAQTFPTGTHAMWLYYWLSPPASEYLSPR